MGSGSTTLSLAVARGAARHRPVLDDVRHFLVPSHGMGTGQLSGHLRFGLAALGCHDYLIMERSPDQKEPGPNLWVLVEEEPTVDLVRGLLDPDAGQQSKADGRPGRISFKEAAGRAASEILGEPEDAFVPVADSRTRPGVLAVRLPDGTECSCTFENGSADLLETRIRVTGRVNDDQQQGW